MYAKSRTLQVFILIVLLIVTTGFVFAPTVLAQKQPAQSSDTSEMLKFTSSGHVLGFQKNGVYVASGSYVLNEGFVEARGTAPQTDRPPAKGSKVQTFEKVIYPDLWKGITLVYDKPPGGVLRSTYHVEQGADPDKIALRYNVPVQVSTAGNLVFEFNTGTMMASAPPVCGFTGLPQPKLLSPAT